MRRILGSLAAAAVLAAGSAESLHAQDDLIGRRASLFELGVYGGGAYSTSWFEMTEGGEAEGFRVGAAPIFGLTATYWANPSLGVRLHGAYMPSHLPDDEHGHIDDDWAVNNWFYDLDLVFRPWFVNPGFMGGTYFFVGAGGLTTNVAGDPPAPRTGGFACVATYTVNGVCLSYDPEYGSVGQAVVGAGFDVFPLTSGIGVFGELAVHGYDSPAHVLGTNARAEDRFAFTPRAALGLKFMFGDILPPPPPPMAVPPVAPQPPVVVEERPMQDIQVCVIQDGTLTTVTGQFNPTTGDTMVAGRRFSEAYPAMTPTYAAGATWFINNEAITIGSDRYVRFGLPRVIGTTEVMRMGEFQGTPIYVEAGATGTPEVVYVPVRPGCEFQPYQRQADIRVRG